MLQRVSQTRPWNTVVPEAKFRSKTASLDIEPKAMATVGQGLVLRVY